MEEGFVVRKTASESTEQEHSTNRPQIHTATRTSEGIHTGAMCAQHRRETKGGSVSKIEYSGYFVLGWR
jgi:hypothetical protein